MDFFHKGGGGGGSKAIQKFWTLFVHQPFWNFGQKKGALTKSRNFWAPFTLILVKYDQKSAQKVPKKKSAHKWSKNWVCSAPLLFCRKALHQG
jgi:hypothetical protein